MEAWAVYEYRYVNPSSYILLVIIVPPDVRCELLILVA